MHFRRRGMKGGREREIERVDLSTCVCLPACLPVHPLHLAVCLPAPVCPDCLPPPICPACLPACLSIHLSGICMRTEGHIDEHICMDVPLSWPLSVLVSCYSASRLLSIAPMLGMNLCSCPGRPNPLLSPGKWGEQRGPMLALAVGMLI